MRGRQKKFNIVLLSINIAILLICAVLFAVIMSLKKSYSMENAAKLWSSDVFVYSQISAYLTPDAGMDIMSVYNMRSAVESKLKENSIVKDESTDEDGRLWIDSSSGECSLTVTGNNGSCETAAMGTWGDFFTFHPEPLLSGSYYSNEDVNFDRIILDKECSWQLFGAVDTAGMTVTINNMTFHVAGVVDTPDNERDRLAYGDKPRVYIPFEAMQILSPDTKMTAYEVCIPEIVKDFGSSIMEDIKPAGDDQCIITDQSGRFDVIGLFKKFGDLPQMAMSDKGLRYPWFENRARGAELIAGVLTGVMVYMLIIPAVSLVYGLFMIVKLLGMLCHALWNIFDRRYQKRIAKAYYKTHPRV